MQRQNQIDSKIDDASVALIQALLLQDSYSYDYNSALDYENDSDDDLPVRRRRKRAAEDDSDFVPLDTLADQHAPHEQKSKRKITKKHSHSAPTHDGSVAVKHDSLHLNSSASHNNLTSHDIMDQQQEIRTGPWREDEEELFLKGLELFGRDWKSLLKYLKTRDMASLRTHVNNHFTKLSNSNTPLPDKVKETGEAYTWTGKPKKTRNSNNNDNSSATPITATPINNSNEVDSESYQLKVGTSLGPIESEDEPIPTRVLRKRAPIKPLEEADPLTLIKCQNYSVKSATDVSDSRVREQPFEIRAHSFALLLADFHAHLLKDEIIGLLVGKYDPTTRVLEIMEACPCKSLELHEHGDFNVEMDPESEIQVREWAASREMSVVGWYHSHPTFLPDPSIRDIENQFNYQQLFKDSQAAQDTPFIGIIIATYDTRLPTHSSAINWFRVDQQSTQQDGKAQNQPFYLKHNIIADDPLPLELALKRELDSLDKADNTTNRAGNSRRSTKKSETKKPIQTSDLYQRILSTDDSHTYLAKMLSNLVRYYAQTEFETRRQNLSSIWKIQLQKNQQNKLIESTTATMNGSALMNVSKVEEAEVDGSKQLSCDKAIKMNDEIAFMSESPQISKKQKLLGSLYTRMISHIPLEASNQDKLKAASNMIYLTSSMLEKFGS